MKFGDVYNFFICQNVEGQLNQYFKLKDIVDYEELKDTKHYFNRMNFIPATGDQDDVTGDISNMFAFKCWDAKKIITPCKETLSDLDPSIGSRMVAIPFLIKRIDLDPDTTTTDKNECYLNIKHINSEAVQFTSYDSLTNKIKLKMLDISLEEENLDEIMNRQYVISLQYQINEDGVGTKTMLNGITVKFDTEVEEFTGIVGGMEDIDMDNNTISVVLDSVPSALSISKFNKIILLSPKNQRMYILPLGTVRNGIDSCKLKPSEVPVVPSISHWNYMMPHATFTTEPKYGLCPAIKCEFPSNTDIVKMIAIVIRDRIVSEVSSGFSILPYVYGV